MSNRIAAALLILAVLITASRELEATVLLPADFAEMVRESQAIVHARVVDVRGELTGDRRSIESLVTVAVLSPLKGPAIEQMVFRIPGGRVGRYRRVFVGAPTFKAGDEVVLFLKGRAPAIARPFGLSQGVYRVTRAGGSPMVLPVPPTDGVANAPRGAPVRRPLALEEFARQVRQAVEATR